MQELTDNSYMLTVGLGDVRKKHALAIAERVAEVIKSEFGDKVGNYAVSASHMKGVNFGVTK